ncbi:MAG: tetratricopeptide repeat protein [Pirellula sp.]
MTIEREFAHVLDQGLSLERVGDLPSAERFYLQIVASHSGWAEGWFRLGLVCLKQKKLRESLFYFDRARGLRFRQAETWNYQGISYGWMGDESRAEHAFRQAVVADPNLADAYRNLGIALRNQNKFDEAREVLLRGLALDPHNLSILSNLSAVHASLGNSQLAVEFLQSALRIDPRHSPSWISLSMIYRERGDAPEARRCLQTALGLDPNSVGALLGMGVLLGDEKRYGDAAKILEKAASLAPTSATVLANLGNAQRELKQFEEAERNLLRAIELEPHNAKAHLNLGTLYSDQRQLPQAKFHFQQSLSLDPNNANCLMGLGSVFYEYGHLEEALRTSRESTEKDRNLAQAHHNLAIILLVQGAWDEGFQEHEWRLKVESYPVRKCAQPQWQGEPLTDQTLLVHAEQGLGDTIQFCRYIRLVKARVKNVIVEVPRQLIPVISSSNDMDHLVASGDEVPHFDYQIPMLSLPAVFRTTPDSVPCDVPYLFADQDRMERWRSRLSSRPAFRIGIAWRGNPTYRRNKDRTIPLANFAALSRIPGVELISLYPDEASQDITSVRDQFQVTDFGHELDRDGAFLDTSALMQCLDLVISGDSAPVHLAGALGVKTWLLCSFVPDWRWLMHRDDSPWYPTVRIFRQSSHGDWPGIFLRVESELRCLVKTASRLV